METKASLIRSDRAVELNAVAAVYTGSALVVVPDDSEFDHSVRFYHAFQYRMVFIFRVSLDHRFQRCQYFFDCLKKLRFIAVLCTCLIQDALDISVHN